MRYFLTLGDASHEIEIQGEGPYRVIHSDDPASSLQAEVYGSSGRYRVYLDGKTFDLSFEGERENLRVEVNGRKTPVTICNERTGDKGKRQAGTDSPGTLNAQMPGRILQVRVKAGDRVTSGSPLLVIEAMKMENELCADRDARVERVLVQAGDAVEAGTPLLLIS